MPDEGRLESRAAFPPDSDFTDADLAAARWSWDADHPTGKGTDTLPGGRWLFVPIRTVRGPVGVIGVLALKEGRELSAADRRLLDAVGNQAAIAIERMTLAADIDQRAAGRGARTLALRHADLGEPRPAHAARLDHRRAVQPQELSRPLRPADPRRASGDGAERGRAARPLRRQPFGHDAARCRRHRAQQGAGRRRRPRFDGPASRRARCCRTARSTTSIEPGLPPLSLDFVLAEQVLFNLFDNAAKYSPVGRPHRASRRGARASASRSSCATRVRASRPRRSTASSTSSIAPTTATGGAPAPAWGSPSPRASSRCRAAAWPAATEAIAAAPNSW